MKFFVDTAILSEIEWAMGIGCDGVTTNPSLIKKAVDALKANGENVDMMSYIRKICETAGRCRDVSLEVVSLESEKMIKEAVVLYNKFNILANNVVVKIPVSTASTSHYEGLKAMSALQRKQIPVNATLVFTPEQALMCGKLGAKYVSPFAGRIDDMLRSKSGIVFDKSEYFPEQGIRMDDNGIVSGIDLVRKTVAILKNYGMKTEVIAASLRNARQVREAALAGAHVATIPFNVLEEMTKHPKTAEGVMAFAKDVVPEYRAIFD